MKQITEINKSKLTIPASEDHRGPLGNRMGLNCINCFLPRWATTWCRSSCPDLYAHTGIRQQSSRASEGQDLAPIGLNHTVKCIRTWGTARRETETGPAISNDAATSRYCTRILQCTRCHHEKEMEWVQLRAAREYRDIHCECCKLHGRFPHNLCQRKVIWHQSPMRRTGPLVHGSREAITIKADKENNTHTDLQRDQLRKSTTVGRTQYNRKGKLRSEDPTLHCLRSSTASSHPARADIIMKVRTRELLC